MLPDEIERGELAQNLDRVPADHRQNPTETRQLRPNQTHADRSQTAEIEPRQSQMGARCDLDSQLTWNRRAPTAQGRDRWRRPARPSQRHPSFPPKPGGPQGSSPMPCQRMGLALPFHLQISPEKGGLLFLAHSCPQKEGWYPVGLGNPQGTSGSSSLQLTRNHTHRPWPQEALSCLAHL